MTSDPLAPFWPLFGLEIRTTRLVLCPLRDADVPELVALVDRGIHDPAVMPFEHPWTDDEPTLRNRRSLQYWWRLRAELSPQSWSIDFIIRHEGAIIGVQGITATNFSTLRELTSGSWLGLAHQRRGFGSEMRAAILAFGFEHLGASAMLSAAHADNANSNGVSRKLGYEWDGFMTKAPRGIPRPVNRFRLTRDRWAEHPLRIGIEVEGLEACRAMLGLGDS